MKLRFSHKLRRLHNFRIQLMGRVVPIKFVSAKFLTEKFSKENEELLGFFDGQSIFLNKDADPQHLGYTFIHELVHATLAFSGVSNMLGENLEESVSEAISNWAHYIE